MGVNLLWMVPGVVGGSEDATVALLSSLAEFPADDIEIVLFGLSSLAAAHPELTERFETVIAPIDGAPKVRRVFTESTWLPRAAARHRIDLLHHGGGTVPPGSRLRCTVTVHDLQPLDLPENFHPLKRTYLRWMIGPSVRRALVTAVPSNFTRERTLALLGASPERVSVVPWPVRERHSGAASSERGAGSVAAPYFVYPSITYHHKDHATLLEAFALIAAAHPDVRLVLIGGEADTEEAVRARITRPDLAGRVDRLGRVDAATRDELVAGALGVVIPSRYEGFGLPAIEAMAAGVAVIGADAGALAEVLAPEVPRPAPGDVAGFAAAMESLVARPDLRAAWIDAGFKMLDRFAPAVCASAMLDVWRRALAADQPTTRP